MAKRRRFTPESELVFEVLSGESSQAEVCRCHNLNDNSHSGSDSCLKMRPPCLSPRISSRDAEKRIAHLEQLVGRMAAALDSKKNY